MKNKAALVTPAIENYLKTLRTASRISDAGIAHDLRVQAANMLDRMTYASQEIAVDLAIEEQIAPGMKVEKPAFARAEDYVLYAGNGRRVRTATKVIFPDGYVVRFMEKMTKTSAIRQAYEVRLRESN